MAIYSNTTSVVRLNLDLVFNRRGAEIAKNRTEILLNHLGLLYFTRA
jgi:hypothetical protein